LNWRSSSTVNCRSSSQRSTSVSNRFHDVVGSTIVPWRGRALSSPLAVSILTASRVTDRLTSCCFARSASVGNGLLSYSPVTIARPRLSSMP
jgi:hypothetical protein